MKISDTIAEYQKQNKHKMTVKSPTSNKDMSLIELIQNPDGFELFADHLVREYAIEVELFFHQLVFLCCF